MLSERGGGEGEEELLRMRILNRRLGGLDLRSARVGPSTVRGAGRGLFAARDCEEGDLLTCYPGDALVLFDINATIWGEHVDDAHDRSRVDQQYMLRAVRDDWGIVALPGLLEEKDPGSYLGHFANDGVGSAPTRESDLSSYVLESFDRANAIHQDFEGCHMVTVATRDIKKGEEIFVTYGPEYWMEQESFVHAGEDDPPPEGGGRGTTGKGFG